MAQRHNDATVQCQPRFRASASPSSSICVVTLERRTVEPMSRATTRPVVSLWRRSIYQTTRLASAPPPKPHDFKPNLSREAVNDEEASADASRNSAASKAREPGDLARGIEASKRVVTTGKLDPRYKAAARRWTALICAMPIALVLSYELFRRHFLGAEQKSIPIKPVKEEDTVD